MNILITSVGRRSYMVNYFKNALGNRGKVFVTNSEPTYAMKLADHYAISPFIYDENYIGFLLDYCRRNDIKSIISLFDIDLFMLAKHKDLFEANGVFLVLAGESTVDICNDKYKTYQFLKKVGLNTPMTYLIYTEALEALEKGEIKFPVIIKPRWGTGSIGVYEASDKEELAVFYKKVKKDILHSYLKYESSQDEDNCILIQEKIYGTEYGITILNDLKGDYVTTVALEKKAMRAGETDIAVTTDNKSFLSTGKIISKHLKHIGPLAVEIFHNKMENKISIIEINCRFSGQYPFFHLAGIDIPRQIVKWLSGETTDRSLLTPKINTLCCKEIVPVKI